MQEKSTARWCQVENVLFFFCVRLLMDVDIAGPPPPPNGYVAA